MIRAGSGASNSPDAADAGRCAAMEAIAALQHRPAQAALVFTTDQYDQTAVVRGVGEVVGSARIIGCCTGGLITNRGGMASGVAVLTLAGDDLEVLTAFAAGLCEQPAQTATRVTEPLLKAIPPTESEKRATVLLFTDGLTGGLSVDAALQHIADTLGPLCSLVGGAAGDNLAYDQTTLFVHDALGGDAIALMLLVSAVPVGIGVHHGWTPMGRHMVVTRSERNMIYELDGRTPLDMYRELLAPQEITPENFRTVTRYHPIGFPRANGECLVRLPLNVHPDGSIECIGMLPEHAIVHIMQGQPDSLRDAARYAARHAVAQLGGVAPAAAMVINCVTRPPLLEGEAEAELAAIREELGYDTPLIGMYSFGEFAADEGPVAFHNKTVAVYVIGQTDSHSTKICMDEPVSLVSRETELSLLYEIASIARYVRSLERLADLVLDKAVRLLGADIAVLYLTDTDEQVLRLQATRGVMADSALPVLRFPATEANPFQMVWAWSVGTGQPAAITALQPSWHRTVMAALGLPLRGSEGVLIGWLYVARLRRATFHQNEVRLYETLAVQASGALDNTLAWAAHREQQVVLAAANAQLEQALRAAKEANQLINDLATPLIPISGDIVIMPLVGAIDERRAQQVLETLLDGVTTSGATLVLLDLTGVAVVDTQVAQVLIQATQAVRLLGAQVMLTGIQPQMAQTLVHLGIDFAGMKTSHSLQAAVASVLRDTTINGSRGERSSERTSAFWE
ncbi:MAG: GAF domain-containing protein [Chloroflexaceae bacterium]|nr:GAF domain-containing protein [Chloroflexaceae bacterium]